jgi:hypothetical protein
LQKLDREAFPFFFLPFFSPLTLPVVPKIEGRGKILRAILYYYYFATASNKSDQRFRAGSRIIMSSSASSSMYPFLHSLLQKAFSPLYPQDVPSKNQELNS